MERAGELRDVDRLIHGPLWRGAQWIGGKLAVVHRAWRKGETASAELAGKLALRWTRLADRPTRRLASDGVWLLAMLAGVLALTLAFSLPQAA